MDIAESSALSLHPSQFSINIPASPGGIHSNRKTRHTRHRLGDGDELQAERGKKRKMPGDDDTNDSPAPAFRSLGNDGNGGSSPFFEQRAKALATQQEASAYSLDRIFTEKELAHATNLAQFATHRFFVEQQQQGSESAVLTGSAAGAVASVPSLDGSAEAVVSLALSTAEGNNDSAAAAPFANSPPASQAQAVEMERQVSYHATRGATKANPLSFLSEAAEAVSATPFITNPGRFLPAIVSITKTDKGAPTPPSMRTEDVADDLALMMTDENDASSIKDRPNGHTDREADSDIRTMRSRYLEQACREPLGTQPFRLPLTDVGPATIREGVIRPAHLGFADPSGLPNGIKEGVPAPTSTANLNTLVASLRHGEPMSRATSMGGSEMGASEVGGVGMRRTRSRLV